MLSEARMKPVGKPDAANRHVPFDQPAWETERRFRQHPLPCSTLLDSQKSDCSSTPECRSGPLRLNARLFPNQQSQRRSKGCVPVQADIRGRRRT